MIFLVCLLLCCVSVVWHDYASKECRRRLAEAYALNKKLNGIVGDEDLKKLKRNLEKEENQEATKRQRRKKIG